MPQIQFIKPNKMAKVTNQYRWILISLIGLLSITSSLQAQIPTPAVSPPASIDSTHNTNLNQASYLEEYHQLAVQRKELISQLTQAQTELLIAQEKINQHDKRYRKTLGWSIPVGLASSIILAVLVARLPY